MHADHRLAPDLGRKAAAGHAGERRVVVIAHPDARDVIGGEADEPRVARRLGGAGLAGASPVGQRARVPVPLDDLIIIQVSSRGGDSEITRSPMPPALPMSGASSPCSRSSTGRRG
jgi:hypothetical protein